MLVKHDIYFSYAREKRTLFIWLPDDYYAPGNDERYAVMYMWDGQNMFYDAEATYGKSWDMAPYLKGWWKSMIVVGMQCAHTDRQRCEEYCPYPVAIGEAGLLEGHAEETMKWVRKVVKPCIDSNYRTNPSREATGVGGSSMGGMMSFYAILRHNDIFSKAAVMPPPVSTSQQYYLEDIRRSKLNPDTRIIFTWGENEWGERSPWEKKVERCILELQSTVKKVQPACRTFALRQEGGAHNEASWARLVPGMMRFLWEG